MTEALTITVEEAARLLGVSRGLAYQAARDGQLPTIRLGRRLLVPRGPLLALVGVPAEMREPGFSRAQGSRGDDDAADRSASS